MKPEPKSTHEARAKMAMAIVWGHNVYTKNIHTRVNTRLGEHIHQGEHSNQGEDINQGGYKPRWTQNQNEPRWAQ